MKESLQNISIESIYQSYEVGRFIHFVDSAVNFYENNTDIVQGIAMSGSVADITNVDPLHSDIDINVIINPNQVFDLAQRLSEEKMVSGFYFDAKAPFPLFHAIADVENRLFRWDTFIFQPIGQLPIDDALRNYRIQILHDPNFRFSQLQFSRVISENYNSLEDRVVHTIDWLLYFWNKRARGKIIDPNNSALFNLTMLDYFPSAKIRLTPDHLENGENLISFIDELLQNSRFTDQISEQNFLLLTKVTSQIKTDLSLHGC